VADDRDREPEEPQGPGPGEEPEPVVPAPPRHRTEGREAADRVGATAQAAARGGILQFLRECWAELGRVQWPNRGQLWQATAVVVIACLVVGVYLYALDSVFTRAAEWLIDQQAG
jgi:preprotein translocase subunit SecE